MLPPVQLPPPWLPRGLPRFNGDPGGESKNCG
jgi:hypothetical protein